MRQLSLLAQPTIAVPDVPGLGYLERFVTESEERELLAAVDAEPWDTEWQRRRQIYGVSYGSASVAPPLPEWSRALAGRVREHLGSHPENIVVNDYLPGQGIALHHDYAAFGPTVVAVSLGSPVLLDLFDPKTKRTEVLDVAPRSLWILGGEARSRWMHGIAHRKGDFVGGVKRARERRVSITFRTRSAARTA